jgi:hypothetical protein
MVEEPREPIPASQRFDGVLMRLTRKYVSERKDIDVLVLSPTFGLIPLERKIPYVEPIGRDWRVDSAKLPEDKLERAKEANIAMLRRVLDRKSYGEIYVNAGKNMRRLIDGFEKTVPSDIMLIYAQGRGIGPKMAHMKEWLKH